MYTTITDLNTVLYHRYVLNWCLGTRTGKAKNGSRGSRKSGVEETTAQLLSAAMSAAATKKVGPPTHYVPGVARRSSGAGQKERDEKRAQLMAAEAMLRYRAEVEYVLPEDLSVDDIKRCFEDGKFHTSLCPLPLPSLSVMGSPTRPDASPIGTVELPGHLPYNVHCVVLYYKYSHNFLLLFCFTKICQLKEM